MCLIKITTVFVSVCFAAFSFGQQIKIDSTIKISASNDKVADEQRYYSNGNVYVYYKPRPFNFITHLPREGAAIVVSPFKRSSLKQLLLLAVSSAGLMMVDEPVTQGVGTFSKKIGLHPEEQYKDVLDVKVGKADISLLKAPQNINTALYQLGQGFPSLIIGAGLFTYGKLHHDYRAISTANQLAESFILMGVGTQLLKRITGRQSPSEAHNLDGSWNLLPSFKNYQNHTPFYDAFPSGHLATLMSTLTVLLQNYPEKKWIAPVGYSLMGMVGYAMINNNVHWISDYPLAIALGYICGKQVIKNNRRVIKNSEGKTHKGVLSYTCNYIGGRVIPGIRYKF